MPADKFPPRSEFRISEFSSGWNLICQNSIGIEKWCQLHSRVKLLPNFLLLKYELAIPIHDIYLVQVCAGYFAKDERR